MSIRWKQPLIDLNWYFFLSLIKILYQVAHEMNYEEDFIGNAFCFLVPAYQPLSLRRNLRRTKYRTTKSLAIVGDTMAMTILGSRYSDDQGIKQDYAEAVLR